MPNEDDPSRVHALVVVHDLPQQVGVGNDDLFTAEGADARGFQANVLDIAGHFAKYHEVADLEGFVHANGQRGEDVAEQRLHGQGDGDTTDTEAGDHGGDVDTQVGQDRQQHHGPDHDADHDADDGGGHRIARLAVAGQALHPQAHAGIHPQRDLERQGDEPAMGHGRFPAWRQFDRLQGDEQREARIRIAGA